MSSKQEILINVTPQETRVAVIENGVVQELHLERTSARGMLGNIFRGKVVRVLPGMQAAFIDIGLSKNGFLPVAEISKTVPTFAPGIGTALTKKSPSIQDLIHPGENVWVQVVKDPIADKGARLTTELSFPSRNLVYLPLNTEIGISQKIACADQRARLKSLVREHVAEHSLAGGFIIRTQAEFTLDDDIRNDMVFLHRLWNNTTKAMQSAPSASLVYEDVSLRLRTLRDLVRDDLELIRIDAQESFESAVEFARDFIPEIVDKIEFYSGERPLFDLYSIEQEIQHALRRKVRLNSGGDLIIDQTEAMTTIDVNSGSYVGSQNHAELVFNINLEAAAEIAHQLRLRNLGGIIIIDFIDMVNTQHKKQLFSALQAALSQDSVKTHITPLSPLGLVEITRKRTHESLERLMCEPCVVCEGRGTVKTVQTVCYEILREILRHHQQFQSQAYTIVASAAVVELMYEQEASSLNELQKFIETPIRLQVEQHYLQQQYDITLSSQ